MTLLRRAVRWFLCPTCGQSCTGSYGGQPVCIRCSPSRWLVK